VYAIFAYLALLIPRGALCYFAYVKNLFGLNEAHNSDTNIECEYVLSELLKMGCSKHPKGTMLSWLLKKIKGCF